MADSREVAALKRALRVKTAQCRRLVEDLDWAEEQVRVYRRLVERLVAQNSREDDHA